MWHYFVSKAEFLYIKAILMNQSAKYMYESQIYMHQIYLDDLSSAYKNVI